MPVDDAPSAIAARSCMAWHRRKEMLYRAVVFLAIAVVAGILGFGGAAVASAAVAKVLFFLFLAIFVITLTLGSARRR